MAIQDVVMDREYAFVNGPGKLSLASSLLESNSVQFTTKQLFGKQSKEIWRVIIDSVTIHPPREKDVYSIRGVVVASGTSADKLTWTANPPFFVGQYDMRKRTGGITVRISCL